MKPSSVKNALAGMALLCAIPAGCGKPVEPHPVIDPGWNGGTPAVLCVEAALDHPGIEIWLDFDKMAAQLLEPVGIKTVKPGKACDAALRINMLVEALSDEYMGILGGCAGTLYTGARVTGSVTLASPSDEQSWPFGRERQPESGVYGDTCPKTPEGSPIREYWIPAMLDGFVQIWGPDVAIRLLDHKDIEIRRAAVYSTAWTDVSKYSDAQLAVAVPGLIRGLEDENHRYVHAAQVTLERLAGVELGDQPEAWQEWWQSRQ